MHIQVKFGFFQEYVFVLDPVNKLYRKINHYMSILGIKYNYLILVRRWNYWTNLWVVKFLIFKGWHCWTNFDSSSSLNIFHSSNCSTKMQLKQVIFCQPSTSCQIQKDSIKINLPLQKNRVCALIWNFGMQCPSEA